MTATLPSNSSTTPTRSAPDLETIDPTSPASPVNVAEYGFEGRFEDWTADTRYFEYTRAADPVGLGYTPSVPGRAVRARALAGRPDPHHPPGPLRAARDPAIPGRASAPIRD